MHGLQRTGSRKDEDDAFAALPGDRRPEGRHHCPARRAPRASRTSPVAGQGAQVLPHRRAASLPRRPRRRPDLLRARLAQSRLRGAVRRRARRRPSRRGHPFYLYDLDAQRRMRETVPWARLIAILRDPVERAHSNWTHLWSAGLEPIGDVVRACAAEERRISAGWAHFWHYIGLGRYGEQLAHLFTLFPREQVLVFRYRDLVDRPVETLDRICAFLGVEQGLLTHAPRENVTAHPDPGGRHSLLSAALRACAQVLPHGVGRALAEPIEHLLQRRGVSRRPLTWDQRRRLIPYFAADIELLQQVTGEDFSDWLRPRDRSGGLVGARPPGQRQSRNGRPPRG
ncbi:sulfotransferase family protein [Nonomuraea recticatena]|uniref:sulfotransferase family protein n=1 Tax=Nonomuraea recticatena TaxID=46178 RepID=UPI00360809FD